MNERTKTGLEILQVAVILGVVGDILLRQVPWGVNVLLFNALFVAGMLQLLHRHAPKYLTRQTLVLFGALVFFASMFAWRDSIELRVADTAAIITILSVLFLPRMKVVTQIAGVFHYGIAFLWSSINAVFSPAALLGADIDWKTISHSGRSRHLVSALRGLAIAMPLLLIFGGLFAAADAAYEGWLQRVFNVRPETVLSHVMLTGALAWLSAGYLRGVLITKTETVKSESEVEAEKADPNLSPVDNVRAEAGERPQNLPNNLSILEHINISDPPDAAGKTPEPTQPKPWEWAKLENTVMPRAFTLGTVEVGVILGLTNLLFLSFVLVQVPYLFGGMDLVQNTPDFKLAEYARRGFGELVTVSALVLPMLLVSHWLVRKETHFTEKLFRVLAGVQIALLFVIMASAGQRLLLLTGNLGYGLSTVRLYPLIFMIWLGVVFAWFGMTVLLGARNYFAWGALWSAFVILGATHILNPDKFIVQTNIGLAQEGREFDARYNASLSDDALPALMDSFENLNELDQSIVIWSIRKRFCEKREETDLRSWNLGRFLATQRINSNEDLVRELGDCAQQPPYLADGYH